MLNFGFWTNGVASPAEAQNMLCSVVGRVAELNSARCLIDVGSGLGAPAMQWGLEYRSLGILSMNINRDQLLRAMPKDMGEKSGPSHTDIALVNGTSVALPFSAGAADRIIALEAAQHFRPLTEFVTECRRVITPGGLLVIAMPVTSTRMRGLVSLARLGILSFTWSSEHYSLEYVKSVIEHNGFRITELRRIGHQVYEPLAEYYLSNRAALREKILKEYPLLIEKILCRSIKKMRQASRDGVIDYVLIKAC